MSFSKSNYSSETEETQLDAQEFLKSLTSINYSNKMNEILKERVNGMKNIPPAPPINLDDVPVLKNFNFNTCGQQFMDFQIPTIEEVCNEQPEQNISIIDCTCGCSDVSYSELLQKVGKTEKKLIYCAKAKLDRKIQFLEDFQIQDPIHNTTLQFESRYESGNLFSAQRLKTCSKLSQNLYLGYQMTQIDESLFQVNEQTYLLLLNPDSNSTSHSQWFNFLVYNTIPNIKYTFIIHNFVKKKSSYNTGMQILVSNNKLQYYTRTGNQIIYTNNKQFLDKGDVFRNHTSLVFSLFFPSSGCYQIVQNFAYTYSQLYKFYEKCITTYDVKSCNFLLNTKTFAYSISKNDLDIWTITEKPYNLYSRERKIIFVTSRIHPGETQSSYIVEGILKYLTDDGNDYVKSLRKQFVFKIVPMLNPDGVILGNYRCNFAGQDLNRKWNNAQSLISPCIKAVQQELAAIKEAKQDIFMYIDIHGHFKKSDVFGYSVENDGFYQYLHYNSIYFNYAKCCFGYSKNKRNTGRVINQKLFGIEHSYCIECSFHGYRDKSKKRMEASSMTNSDRNHDEVESDNYSESDRDFNNDISLETKNYQQQCRENTVSEDIVEYTPKILRQIGVDLINALKIFVPEYQQYIDLPNIIQQVEEETVKEQFLNMQQGDTDSDEDISMFKNGKQQKKPNQQIEDTKIFEKLIEKEIGYESIEVIQKPPKKKSLNNHVNRLIRPQTSQTDGKSKLISIPNIQQAKNAKMQVQSAKPAKKSTSQGQISTDRIILPSKYVINNTKSQQSSLLSSQANSVSQLTPFQPQQFELDKYCQCDANDFQHKRKEPITSEMEPESNRCNSTQSMVALPPSAIKQKPSYFQQNIIKLHEMENRRKSMSQMCPAVRVQSEKRIIYETQMDLQREKQRFDYEFYYGNTLSAEAGAQQRGKLSFMSVQQNVNKK